MTRLLTLALALLLLPAPALAQGVVRACTQCQVHHPVLVRPVVPMQAPAVSTDWDASLFMNWINGVRSQHGLAMVYHDANLAAWASSNNAAQARRGLGHHVLPNCRQNAAMAGSLSAACQSWMGSPPHRALILSPTLRAVGIAGGYGYFTLNGL